MTPSFPKIKLDQQSTFRIIPSKYPPIDLFEDIAHDPADWELLAELEGSVNPRMRQDVGEISLVPIAERVKGPGSTWIMGPFTHINPLGSRFSDGKYGVYYAADTLKTAIQETVYHLEKRLIAGQAYPDDLDQRVILADISGTFADITGPSDKEMAYHHPDTYEDAQKFGALMRNQDHDGLYYKSVRHSGHRAYATFRPRLITHPRQERHLRYHWNGRHINKYFDYLENEWITVTD